jgi:hypothetical protein
VHRNTAFRWRHRFLHLAKDDRAAGLAGIAEADELFLLESQKGSRQLDRPPRKRGGVASRRGINPEHVCVLVARDRTGNTFDFVTGRGAVTAAQLQRHLRPVLDPDVLLVTDSHPAYRAFARAAGISHEAVNVHAGERVRGRPRPERQCVSPPLPPVARPFQRHGLALSAELSRLAVGGRRPARPISRRNVANSAVHVQHA